jgi:hypothetical protein
MVEKVTRYQVEWRVKRFSILLILIQVVSLGACNAGIQATQDEPLEFLFVGNSFTFFNNMPLIFADLAESGGYQVNVTSVARGGFSLEQHAKDLATLDMLENKDWDFVVLQERSGIPAIAEERDVYMYPLVRLLNEQVLLKGGESVLFMTWGNRDGLPRAGHHNYEAMQSQIASAYIEIGNELDVRVAPVGIAWQQVLEQDPQFDLWGMDGIHPSLMGSFLAANVFYATIFDESPVGLAFSNEDDIGEEAREFLQGIAADVVLGDPELWNIP